MPKKHKVIDTDKLQEVKESTSKKTQEEMNSLEQMIDVDEEIDFSQLKEFLTEPNIESSPSLRKINAPQRNPIMLEKDIITGSMTINNTNKEEENGFKYLPAENKPNEPKYIHYENVIINNIIQKKEFENLSAKNAFEKREVRFENSPQTKISAQENFEKYNPVGRLNKDLKVRKNPFEGKEIKYTPEKY